MCWVGCAVQLLLTHKEHRRFRMLCLWPPCLVPAPLQGYPTTFAWPGCQDSGQVWVGHVYHVLLSYKQRSFRLWSGPPCPATIAGLTGKSCLAWMPGFLAGMRRAGHAGHLSSYLQNLNISERFAYGLLVLPPYHCSPATKLEYLDWMPVF